MSRRISSGFVSAFEISARFVREHEKRNVIGSASSRGRVSLDEQDDYYVLVDEQRTLTPIANLEAHGFPMEGIARHVGLKVTVRGISNSGTSRPVFKVRSFDAVSENSAPQKQQLIRAIQTFLEESNGNDQPHTVNAAETA